MSYALFSEDGYKRDVASINGYYEMLKFCMENGGAALKSFVENGQTEDVQDTRADIENVMAKCSDPDVKKTLQGLLDGLQGIKEIAIISDYQ